MLRLGKLPATVGVDYMTRPTVSQRRIFARDFERHLGYFVAQTGRSNTASTFARRRQNFLRSILFENSFAVITKGLQDRSFLMLKGL